MVFVRQLHLFFVFLLITLHLGIVFHTPNDTRKTKMPSYNVYRRK